MTRPGRPRRGPLRAALALSLEADRRATLITFVSFGLRPTIPVVILYLVRVVVDAIVAHDQTTLWTAVGAAALATGLSMGSISYAIELNVRMIEATAAVVDRRLMRTIGGLPGVAHLDNPEVLDRVEMLRQERVHLSEGGDVFSLVIGAVVRALVTGLVLAMVQPLLLFLPLLALPSLLASRRGQRKRSDAIARSATTSRLAGHLYATGTSLPAGKEIRLFGLGPALRERYRTAAADADATVTRAVWGGLALNCAGGALFAVGYCGALFFVLHDFARGTTSLGDVVLVLGLVTSISTQLGQAVVFAGFLQQVLSASRRLLWLERYAADVARPAPTAPAPGPRLSTGIRFEGVHFQYPDTGTSVLRDIDLELPAGTVVAVVGANGAGKSTLIKLLTGLYEPTRGRITVDGVDLREAPLEAWYARTSGCFQDFSRLEFTVQHSVGVGSVAHADEAARVLEAVKRAAAADLVERLPNGLATELGASFDAGTELSGGQWQRIALARACMRRAPCLLVLDEPTAAIDPLAEDALLSAYVDAARRSAAAAGGITLFASHRLSTARNADLIVVVEGGRIVQLGRHGDLMTQQDSIYRDLYERQARAYA
ncbi:ABC transporter ATP-binding protein [Streptomyces longisporus]|uniref:ABC transporter ATP-binding protein n=1 Tax=Streptomyces longisporus TaxID=1948 RepID=A0ABN3LSW7_STRLO